MLELKFLNELPKEIPSELMVYSTQNIQVKRKLLSKIQENIHVASNLSNISILRPDINISILRPDINISELQPSIISDFSNISRRFPEFKRIDNWSIGKFGQFSVAMNHLSGSLRYRDAKYYGEEMDMKFDIPVDQIVNIGREFIDNAKLLKSSAEYLKMEKITYMRSQSASINGDSGEEKIIDAGVIFSRKIDEIKVAGFGGSIMINIAPNKSVVGINKNWRHRNRAIGLTKVTVQPEMAIEIFKKRLQEKGHQGIITVKKADFCYFEASENFRQKYLEPNYAFLYETQIGDFSYKSVEIIPATRYPKNYWNFKKRFPSSSIERK